MTYWLFKLDLIMWFIKCYKYSNYYLQAMLTSSYWSPEERVDTAAAAPPPPPPPHHISNVTFFQVNAPCADMKLPLLKFPG
jgi:hypothetical protein